MKKYKVWNPVLKKMLLWEDVNLEPLCKIFNTDLIPLQFTGLFDKQGKEIYESDIIIEDCPRANRYKVFRAEGGFVINTHKDDFFKPIEKIWAVTPLADMQTVSYIKGSCEVKGNIYEHPELLTPASSRNK